MTLFSTAVRRVSLSLLRFLFLNHIQVSLREISLICRLKCPYSCFASQFYFLVISVPMMIMLSVLFLMALPPRLCKSSSHCIDASTLAWMLLGPLPPSFLDTYSLSVLSVGYKTLYIVITFLVLWSICLSSSLVHFKNCPEHLTRGTALLFIPLMRFLQWNLVLCSFLVHLWFFF